VEHQSAGRVYIGLGILGWGLAILLQVAPHEDPLVGAGLALFGLALLITAPAWPRVERLSPWLTLGLGILLAGGMVVYDAILHAPLNVTKVAIVVYGLLLLAATPFLRRSIAIRGTDVPVSTVVAGSLAAVGVPLAAWGFQAMFKSAIGATPVEAFIQYGLLVPMVWLLRLFGWGPSIDGQVLAYSGADGPLRVEVGAACSGVQAMALFSGVLALFLLVERPKGGRLLTWTAIGLAGVYVTNLMRLASLMAIGYQWGSEALIQAHEQAGWIFFVAWALLFAWLVRSTAARATKPETTVAPVPERVGVNVQKGRSEGFSP
jgi:exosortase/archaeosortase family protein